MPLLSTATNYYKYSWAVEPLIHVHHLLLSRCYVRVERPNCAVCGSCIRPTRQSQRRNRRALYAPSICTAIHKCVPTLPIIGCSWRLLHARSWEPVKLGTSRDIARDAQHHQAKKITDHGWPVAPLALHRPSAQIRPELHRIPSYSLVSYSIVEFGHKG